MVRVGVVRVGVVRVRVYHYCPPVVASNDINSYDIALVIMI